ncbi:spore coat protein [Ferdinandcohnia sp. SAFN-114]|uniref:spore coat protein n=1 Tax=Ferdinandcohnia sp. SAFN-114 TaxID=3387275 RepID=UPI003F7D8D0B
MARYTLGNQNSPVNARTTTRTSPHTWSALNPLSVHPLDDSENQEVQQFSKTEQVSSEAIVIRDSADIEVSTTDTQAAITLQAAIQAAIALVIRLSIADSTTSDRITQELTQYSKVRQINQQTTLIENSRGVRVTTTDTDVAISIQISLQILLALVAQLDIL